jgi:hypothetical protein
MLNNLSLDSPNTPRMRMSNPRTGDRRIGHGLQIGPQDFKPEDIFSPLSPGVKRRRHEQYRPTSSGHGGPYYNTVPLSARPSGPYQFPVPFQMEETGRRENQFRPNDLIQRGQDPRGMPPGQQPETQASVLHRRNQKSIGETLSLPPLQINVGAHNGDLKRVIGSMPFMNKIAVLGRVAPPMSRPSTSSSAPPESSSNRLTEDNDSHAENDSSRRSSTKEGVPTKARGAIIAVEAEDSPTAKDLASWLESFLTSEGSFAVRMLQGPDIPTADFSSAALGFEAVHNAAQIWCNRTQEITSFITGTGNLEQRSLGTSGDAVDSTKTVSASSAEEFSTSQDSANTEGRGIPALIINSYHLATTDAFTTHTPLLDAYSITDHWQWMATQWRGTMGPDLTVYIKDVPTTGAGPSSGGLPHLMQQTNARPSGTPLSANPLAGQPATNVGTGTDARMYGLSRGHGVEIHEGVRVLVVKRDATSDMMAAHEGSQVKGLSEGALRRVGFEVGEWIRSINAGGR